MRDEFLTKEGYFVYRIKWNEINSIEGKQLMKDKIELFLEFYKTFNMEVWSSWFMAPDLKSGDG